jgi:DNA mismatch repair protein MutS2
VEDGEPGVPEPPSGNRNRSTTDVRRKKGSKGEETEGGTSAAHLRQYFFNASPGVELDLRGRRSDDALEMLDRYLEKAYMSGLPFVRIIHGKGTGKLRQDVRNALQDHPHVISYEEGGEKEGGAGVTVAKLASS